MLHCVLDHICHYVIRVGKLICEPVIRHFYRPWRWFAENLFYESWYKCTETRTAKILDRESWIHWSSSLLIATINGLRWFDFNSVSFQRPSVHSDFHFVTIFGLHVKLVTPLSPLTHWEWDSRKRMQSYGLTLKLLFWLFRAHLIFFHLKRSFWGRQSCTLWQSQLPTNYCIYHPIKAKYRFRFIGRGKMGKPKLVNRPSYS